MIYRTKFCGEVVEISGNFAQASSQVFGVNGGRQVADFRHRPKLAMKQALSELVVDSGDQPTDDINAEIDQAISEMVTINQARKD